MIDPTAYTDLIAALSKLFGGKEDSPVKEPAPKKEGKAITIIAMGKPMDDKSQKMPKLSKMVEE